MAKFKITKETTVGDLKKQFADEIGGTLRIYDDRSQAEDDVNLVSLGAKTGELECRTSRTVGKFEEAFKDEFNLKVKVFTVDDWVHVLSGVTLESVSKIKRQARKADMEQFVAYKREEGTEESAEEPMPSQEEDSAAQADTGDEPSWLNDYLKQLKNHDVVSYANPTERKMKLKALCDKIKDGLVKQGSDSFILYSDDDDEYNENMEDLLDNKGYFYDDILNGGCFVGLFDCGDYGKEMRLYRVFIEDDELKFNLREFEADENGCYERDSFEVNFDDFMNGWWIRWEDQYDTEDYCPEQALYVYLGLITDVLPEL